MTRRPWRVVLAEDSPIVRAGLARLLEDVGVDVVGHATDVPSLLAVVAERAPDAVISDVRMPPSQTHEGVTAARALRAEHPDVGVLLLSQHAGSPAVLRFIEEAGGGIGYLVKDRVADARVLVEALERVLDGGTVIDAEVAERLVATRRELHELAALSGRELQVLALMAEGLSNAAIAERLTIAEKTVEQHVRAVLAIVGVPANAAANRRVLAVLAYLRSRRELDA